MAFLAGSCQKTAKTSETPQVEEHPAMILLENQNFSFTGNETEDAQTLEKLERILEPLATDSTSETIRTILLKVRRASPADLPKWEKALYVVNGPELESQALQFLETMGAESKKGIPPQPNDNTLIEDLGQKLADGSPETLGKLLAAPPGSPQQKTAEAAVGYVQDPKFLGVIEACIENKKTPDSTRKTGVAMLGYIPDVRSLQLLHKKQQDSDLAETAREALSLLKSNNPGLK
jgi:hypothetical protein